MMLQLQRFTFSVVYRKGKDMFIADTLSRAPLASTTRHPYEASSMIVHERQLCALQPAHVPGQTHCC